MSGRSGIYEGPDGTKLYGDGREVNPVDTSKWRDKPAATGSEEPKCPKCGGKRNNRCFLWTRTTGWGDVECGPECDDSFHAKDTPISPAILARRARALLRANSRPTPPAIFEEQL